MIVTALSFAERAPGKFLSSRGGILVPDGDTYFSVSLARPDPTEAAWPSRGTGGKADTHFFDNERAQAVVGGLDTEILRAYFWLSLDGGLTWKLHGHLGTTGGHLVGLDGKPLLHTSYLGELPEGIGRRLQVVLDVREALRTDAIISTDARKRPPVLRLDDHHSIAVTSTASGSSEGASSVTTSGNVTPSGSDRYLVVYGGNLDTAGPATYTSIVFGGVTQTQITNDGPFQTYFRLASAGDVNPSTTGATCTYTVANAETVMLIGAVAFSGVDQTTPRDTPPALSSGTTTAPSHTVTAGDAGDVRIAGVIGGAWTGGIAIGTGETSRVELENVSANNLAVGICTKEDGGSDAMNWTPGPTIGWGMRGFNINMAVSAITGTGVFAAQSATMGGSGISATLSTLAAFAAQDATVAGSGISATRSTVGALVADAAAMAGSGISATRSTLGAMAAQAATMVGVGKGVSKSVISALVAQSAALVGTGTTGSLITGVGALVAQAATMAGAGISATRSTLGAMAAQAATMAGSGIGATRSVIAALVAQAATLAGTGAAGDIGEGVASVLRRITKLLSIGGRG